VNGNQPWTWLTDLFLGDTTTDTSRQPTRINVPSDGAHDQRHRINQATDTTALNRSGSHLHQIVSDTHRAVTNLTEQDTDNRAQQRTGSHTADSSAVHISDLVRE
jgi:hypothetical protein